MSDVCPDGTCQDEVGRGACQGATGLEAGQWHPQATSRMCFVCGRENPVGLHIQFYEKVEDQQIVAPLKIPDQYQGYPGIAHGGVLAAILDETAGRAIMMAATERAKTKSGWQPGEDIPFWVTAKLEIRYRCPTPTEMPLTVVGWVVHRKTRSAEVSSEIRLPDGTVSAEATAVVVCPSKETLREWEQEKDFWRVET